jgi:hypothetical protein
MAGAAAETRTSKEATTSIAGTLANCLVALAGRTHARNPLPEVWFET